MSENAMYAKLKNLLVRVWLGRQTHLLTLAIKSQVIDDQYPELLK